MKSKNALKRILQQENPLYIPVMLCHNHQGAVFVEVAPGAPQERSNTSITAETAEASQLRERWTDSVWSGSHADDWAHGNINVCVYVSCVFRLFEVEQSLADERARRETAEEALRVSEERAKRWDPHSVTYLSLCFIRTHTLSHTTVQGRFKCVCVLFFFPVLVPVCPETVRETSASRWKQRRSGKLSVSTQTSL